jgi:hypothetical protein
MCRALDLANKKKKKKLTQATSNLKQVVACFRRCSNVFTELLPSNESKDTFYEAITLSKSPDWLWGPPNLLYNGYSEFLPGVTRPGREAEH